MSDAIGRDPFRVMVAATHESAGWGDGLYCPQHGLREGVRGETPGHLCSICGAVLRRHALMDMTFIEHGPREEGDPVNEDDDAQDFTLVLPFDSDSPEFVRGVQVGILWQMVSPLDQVMCYASNAEMVARIMERHPNKVVVIGDSGDWITIRKVDSDAQGA